MAKQGSDRTVKREQRALAKALESVAAPVPPAGLRERLLAPAAVDTPLPLWKRTWKPALAGGVALAAFAAWPGSCRTVASRSDDRSDLFAIRSTQEPRTQQAPFETQIEPDGAAPYTVGPPPDNSVVELPPKRNGEKAPTNVARPKPTGTGDLVAANLPEPKMSVTIGHATPSNVGTAKAASWRQDETGRWVKTEWKKTEGPGKDKEVLTISDSEGHEQTMTVEPGATEKGTSGETK